MQDKALGPRRGLGRVVDPLQVSEPVAVGLASAYFLVSFLFAGYVLKLYVEIQDRLHGLVQRLDKFKYLEAHLDEVAQETMDMTLGQEDPDA